MVSLYPSWTVQAIFYLGLYAQTGGLCPFLEI